MSALYPLQNVTNCTFQKLVQTLWSWQICENCLTQRECQSEDCTWSSRATLLQPYFRFYRVQTSTYESVIGAKQTAALTNHDGLLRIIKILMDKHNLTKAALLDLCFPMVQLQAEHERAIDLAVRVMLMLRSADSRYSERVAEHGESQPPWRMNVSFSDFVASVLPITNHPRVEEIKQDVRATRLVKLAKLSLEGTDDLRNHLKIDRERGVVQIFHHTSFLKEQLRLTRSTPAATSILQPLRLYVVALLLYLCLLI